MIALETQWAARGIVPEQLARESSGTLGRLATVAASAEDHVPPTSVAGGTPVALEDALVEIGPVLGEGGMGVVRLARQLGLRREVAVKQLHPNERSPHLARALLREAWISGNLEHPNIVPVHALSHTDGGPLLVMKRIEGTPLTALLTAANSTEDAVLERNLDVIVQVCHSIHFAHDRSVLHLDIKPDNIMVGRFGEVYLLDWGVAVGIGNDGPAWMPAASGIDTIVGTPSYMSPEQACGDGERLDVRTDVYLLGATLHHVVTVKPLHDGETLRDVLEAAFASTPREYAPDVPAEVVAIIARATAPQRADRFDDADAFRRAVEDFRRHKSSRQLSREASDVLDRIRPALSPGALERTTDSSELERAIADCRYGFQHALRVWSENEQAERGLADLLRLIIRHAIEQRDWRRATATLEALDEPDEALAAEVGALRDEIRRGEAKVAELEELERQMDLTTHGRIRRRVALAGAPTWLLWNLGCAWLHKSGVIVFDHLVLVLSACATFLLYGGVLIAVRRTLLTTRVNRYAMLLLLASFAGVLPLWMGAARLAIDPLSAVALSLSGYVFFLVAMAATVDRRVLWAAAPVAAACTFAIIDPRYAFEMNGVAGALIAAVLWWVWRSAAHDASTER